MELVLTTEDLLRLIHSHKRFITGKKTIKPIVKAATENKLEIHFLEWISLAFKEISHQLWGGQRYDTLEIIQQILNSNLVRYSIEWYHDHIMIILLVLLFSGFRFKGCCPGSGEFKSVAVVQEVCTILQM